MPSAPYASPAAPHPGTLQHQHQHGTDPHGAGAPAAMPKCGASDAQQQEQQGQLPPFTHTLGEGFMTLEQEKQNILREARL